MIHWRTENIPYIRVIMATRCGLWLAETSSGSYMWWSQFKQYCGLSYEQCRCTRDREFIAFLVSLLKRSLKLRGLESAHLPAWYLSS